MRRNIYLIRHGECADKQQGEQKFSAPDVCMSEYGVKQVKNLRNTSLMENVKIVYISPLPRAEHTARILFGGIKDIQIKDCINFKEIDFGACNGKFFNDDHEIYRLWQLSPDMLQFPNGDKMIDYIDRTNVAFKRILKNENSCDIALVAHSITIRAIVLRILSLDPKYIRRIPCDNASITVICEEEDCLSLRSLNII